MKDYQEKCCAGVVNTEREAGPITNEFDRLREMVYVIQSGQGSLENRLESVLTPSYPCMGDVGNKKDAPEPVLPTLAEQIRELRRVCEQIHYSQSSTLERIGI